MSEIAGTKNKATNPEIAYVPRRSSRWRLVAAGAAVAGLSGGVVYTSSFMGGPSGHGPEALAVERLEGSKVAIQVVNTEASAVDMTRELHRAGLHITVATEAAAPQLVGRWTAMVGYTDGTEQQARAEQELLTQIGSGGIQTLEITMPGPPREVRLYIGRATKRGETPMATGGMVNAASPGGLLYCYRLSGDSPAHAASVLRTAGHIVHWRDDRQESDAQQRERIAHSPTPPAGLVTRAVTQTDAIEGATNQDIYLFVAPPADPAFLSHLWDGYGLTARSTGNRDYGSCKN